MTLDFAMVHVELNQLLPMTDLKELDIGLELIGEKYFSITNNLKLGIIYFLDDHE